MAAWEVMMAWNDPNFGERETYDTNIEYGPETVPEREEPEPAAPAQASGPKVMSEERLRTVWEGEIPTVEESEWMVDEIRRLRSAPAQPSHGDWRGYALYLEKCKDDPSAQIMGREDFGLSWDCDKMGSS
jgi:hypothetical protein